MLLYFDLLWLENLGYNAILIGDERGAECSHSRLAIHLLLAIGTKLGDEFLVGIGYEREWQVVLCNELLVAFSTLNAHSDNCIALGKEALIVVTKTASLIGATRCGVLRINVKHEFLTIEITQLNLFAVLVSAKYFRQFLSYFHNNVLILF